MMVSSEYMENRIPDLERENEELRKTLREVVMRQQLQFPETEQDLKWFEEEIKGMSEEQKMKFFIQVSEILGLGKIDS